LSKAAYESSSFLPSAMRATHTGSPSGVWFKPRVEV
jgi:hypothetical protein